MDSVTDCDNVKTMILKRWTWQNANGETADDVLFCVLFLQKQIAFRKKMTAVYFTANQSHFF